MNHKLHHFQGYTRSILLLGILLLFFFFAQKFNGKENTIDSNSLHFSSSPSLKINLVNFDPNTYDLEDWKKIGFSEKDAHTILKYRDVVGGKFTSKGQFKKCYSISDEKYAELEPYLLLPDFPKNKDHQFEIKSLSIQHAFDPNTLTENDWQQMGFSEKQANSIIKYKKFLGGRFDSKESLKNCFVISDANYKQMSQFISLPEKARSSAKSSVRLAKFDPNILDVNGWVQLGFTENQAASIIKYRDKVLKGSFKNIDDLQKCFVISDQKFAELKPYIQLTQIHKSNQQTDFASIDLNKISFKQLLEFGFNEKAAGSFIGFRNKLGGFANTQQMMDTYNIDKDLMQKLINTAKFSSENITKYSLIEAPEEWLKTHPYFKYSADKIIFHRATLKTDADIWKALKLKPEYETRMRWYVK